MPFTPLGQQPQPEEKPESLYGKATSALKSFSTGVAKGELQTLQGLGQLGLKAVKAVTGKDYGTKSTFFEDPSALEAKNLGEKVGKTTEQIAEFFVPASKVSKAEAAITALTSGMPKLAGAAARISGKALVTAAADTAVASAQKGDVGEGLKTGLLAGGIRGGLGVAGEAARAMRLPERLYQTVFKNASRDMMDEFKTDYLVDLYKTRPHVFNDLVEQGIVKVDGGVPVLNQTLAEQALERGLKGNITSMGKTVAGGVLESESQVRNIVKSYKGTVGLDEPEFFNILREISDEYKNVGFGNISNEADKLAKVWLEGKGKVSGETALAIRRLLDKARLARSFEVPVQKLSLSQANLKLVADEARKRLNKIPGLEKVMGDYSFYLDALEALGKEGARRGNNQVLSLIDSVFLGAGMAAGDFKQAITLAGLRKYLQSGRGATAIGSSLANPNIGVKGAGAIGAGANLLAGEGQEQTNPQMQESRKSSFTPYVPSY